ncbi:MAG: HAD family hydrolase [Kiritimatiellae bacterium]|nr:HAD family hydrolase [Kiritimatiellia bacterium]
MKHVLWDWNGTLLDDTPAALDTLNKMILRRGGRPITMAFYRDNFAFPVKPFYERIGIVLENEDWDSIAIEYHDVYAAEPKELNRDSLEALALVEKAGARQSIISALRQDLLEGELSRRGIAGRFDHVCGVDNLDGAGKIHRALELRGMIAGDDAVVIGDALHDKEVADAIGAKCVLCAQGSHSAGRLRKVAPTGGTLLEAVRIALAI